MWWACVQKTEKKDAKCRSHNNWWDSLQCHSVGDGMWEKKRHKLTSYSIMLITIVPGTSNFPLKTSFSLRYVTEKIKKEAEKFSFSFSSKPKQTSSKLYCVGVGFVSLSLSLSRVLKIVVDVLHSWIIESFVTWNIHNWPQTESEKEQRKRKHDN